MANDPKKKAESLVDEEEVVWGGSKQERITDKAPHHKSERHECKGPACDHAFEKL